MTTLEEHRKKIKEHLDEIEDAINEGIEKKPITIGFHSSSCAIQFLETYLHAINKISPGKQIHHEWFKKPEKEQKKEPLVERKMPVKFLKKEEIYALIYDLEEERNKIVYGKPLKEQAKEILNKFLMLKEIFKELLKNEGIEI